MTHQLVSVSGRLAIALLALSASSTGASALQSSSKTKAESTKVSSSTAPDSAKPKPKPARPKPVWPVKGPEPLPGSILPNKRIIAYYGNPMSKRMGILGEIAPEADLTRLKSNVSFRDQLDIDSMDFLNFVIALDEELDVKIPESD